MKLNFESFIDIGEHNKKIQCNAQEIKNKYSISPQAANLYLNALSDLFLEDINRVSDVIYENIMLEKSLRNLEFTLEELRDCISNGALYFILQYEGILNSHNIGAMFSNHPDLQQYKNYFIERANKILKKRTDFNCSKYSDHILNNRYSSVMLVFTIIAAASATIAAIPIIKDAYVSLLYSLHIHIV